MTNQTDAPNKEHKRILTGIKPTGIPHLGNYVGAIRPAIESIQNSDDEAFFFANYPVDRLRRTLYSLFSSPSFTPSLVHCISFCN